MLIYIFGIYVLSTVCSEFIGQGKAVDTDIPILPLQMLRGYGRTVVLWKRSIDHLIATLPDGGNRIQCVGIKGPEPVLLVSALCLVMVCRDALMSLRMRWTS